MCHKFLQAIKIENKIKHVQKNKNDIDSHFCYKRNHKEIIKNNNIILETKQKLKSERHMFLLNKLIRLL